MRLSAPKLDHQQMWAINANWTAGMGQDDRREFQRQLPQLGQTTLANPRRPPVRPLAQDEIMPRQSRDDACAKQQQTGSAGVRIEQVCDSKSDRQDQAKKRRQREQR